MKCVALNANIRKEVRSKINDLRFYHTKLEKEEESKPKVNIKIKIEINDTENRQLRRLTNIKLAFWKDQQNWQTPSYTDQEKENTNHNYQEWKEINTSESVNSKRVVREYYEQYYVNEHNHVNGIATVLKKYTLSKFTQEEPMNSPI